MPPYSLQAETIHPALWHASQLARAGHACVDSGYPALSAEMPGAGWPIGALVELLLPQLGTAEIRLLQPALRALGDRPIALIQPPYLPQIAAFAGAGIAPSRLLWVRCEKHADALWAAEQILRAGNCGAVLCWHTQIRREALQRLHLAAQQQDSLFIMMRPLQSAQTPSPAVLRLGLQLQVGGVAVSFIKRRGNQRDRPLWLPLPSIIPIADDCAITTVDRSALTAISARDFPTELVN